MNTGLPFTLNYKDMKRYIGRHIGLPIEIDSSEYDKELLGIYRRLQRNTWIYAGFMNDDIIASLAIVDAGMLAIGFSYIFDRKTQ